MGKWSHGYLWVKIFVIGFMDTNNCLVRWWRKTLDALMWTNKILKCFRRLEDHGFCIHERRIDEVEKFRRCISGSDIWNGRTGIEEPSHTIAETRRFNWHSGNVCLIMGRVLRWIGLGLLLKAGL